MRVEKIDTDYYIFLSCEDIMLVSTRITERTRDIPLVVTFHPSGEIKETKMAHFLNEGHYPFLIAPIFDRLEKKVLDRYLALTATRSALVLSNEHTHDKINFKFEEWGEPTVRVYPPKFSSLLRGESFIVTRYDGISSKLWIWLEDDKKAMKDE